MKKKIRAFEESFEAEHGKKPTTQEKNAKLDIKKALVELAKSRKELKSEFFVVVVTFFPKASYQSKPYNGLSLDNGIYKIEVLTR